MNEQTPNKEVLQQQERFRAFTMGLVGMGLGATATLFFDSVHFGNELDIFRPFIGPIIMVTSAIFLGIIDEWNPKIQTKQ